MKRLVMAVINTLIVNTVYSEVHMLQPVPIEAVRIEDSFWRPKLDTWNDITLIDVLDKFEGAGAFRNFDRVAGTLDGDHEGPPWFDGLIYETIRAAADFLISYPNQKLEDRIDGYIKRIALAQSKDTNGYIMTYTQLTEPGHQWGLNGGYLRWQHDVYNAGALVEAAVHYYRATGKNDLLEVAVRLANHMCDVMGSSPKKNIVPSHSLPEEALVELSRLVAEKPALKTQLPVPADADRYLKLVEFWLENRGNSCGQPTSLEWARDEPGCQRWIRRQQYPDNSRPSWGDYAQDDKSVFLQETIEGHAVRATLMCTGLCAMAIVNHEAKYFSAVSRLWDNMVGRRMHITGGVGAYAHEEKFGPDYVLPNDAYLETCAAVGAGFFHRNMNLLFADAKYIDELERTLYNNVLNGVSLEGTRYYYQNPLSSNNHHRWKWHGCPCCPPMFLKIVSALPGYIYASDDDGVYVNLFIGSTAHIVFGDKAVTLTQTTSYPWKGDVSINVEPEKEAEFAVNVRLPGWAQGWENPYGLYKSDMKGQIAIKVNGESLPVPKTVRGYVVLKRRWKKGDTVLLQLPVQPRRVYAYPRVNAADGRVAIAAGPLVYCAENIDNPGLQSYYLDSNTTFQVRYEPKILGGINIITATAMSIQDGGEVKTVPLTAIPFYCQDNRSGGGSIEVWLTERSELATPLPSPTIANQSRVSVSHCFENDTITGLNDDIDPADSNDHSIPRFTWWDHKGTVEWAQYDFDTIQKVSSAALYWWDDRPAGGNCAVPESWRLLYKCGEQWKPVKSGAAYGTKKDQYNHVAFEPVMASGLRVEVKLQNGYSGGILEWRVE